MDACIDAARVQHRAAPFKHLTAQTQTQRFVLTRIELPMHKNITELGVAESGAGCKALITQRLVGQEAIGVMAVGGISFAQCNVFPGMPTDEQAQIVFFQIKGQHRLEHRRDRVTLAKVQIGAPRLTLQSAPGQTGHRSGGPIGIGVRAG